MGVGIAHKGVNLIISGGDERPKGVNEAGNIEPHMIGFDLENILDKLVEQIFIIHFLCVFSKRGIFIFR